MEQNIYRCTFTNDYHKVGNRIDSFKFKSLPDYVRGDYKIITDKDSGGNN